jgi:FkbM family methyltransferase
MYCSQVGQDKWVQSVLGNKRAGFFIELGGADGIEYSNTLFFERELGWNGICIEPNPMYKDLLRKNRSCNISYNCVSDVDDTDVDFALCGLLSGVVETSEKETSRDQIIKVKTKTIRSILAEFNAPKIIDYLSLDVEGHEYTILKVFPFNEYIIRCITVEHNEPHYGQQKRNDIRKLLEENGYIFVKGNDDVMNWKHGPIDDFYIHSSISHL